MKPSRCIALSYVTEPISALTVMRSMTPHVQEGLIHRARQVAEEVSELIVDQPTVTMKRMLLKDSLIAWEQSPVAPPAAPMKISWRMWNPPHMPEMQTIRAHCRNDGHGAGQIAGAVIQCRLRTVDHKLICNL